MTLAGRQAEMKARFAVREQFGVKNFHQPAMKREFQRLLEQIEREAYPSAGEIEWERDYKQEFEREIKQ